MANGNLATGTRNGTVISGRSDLAADWFALARKFFMELDSDSKTVKAYGTALKRYTLFCTGSGLVPGSRQSVLNWKKSMAETEGLKPNSVNLYLSGVKKFSHWLKFEGYQDFADGIKALKIPAGFKRDWLDLEGLRRCERIARNDWEQEPANPAKARNYGMFILACVCGLRVMEIRGLDVCDLDSGFIWVRSKKQQGKQRVNVPEHVLQVLRAYARIRGLEGHEPGPLFIAHGSKRWYTNRRLSEQAISTTLKKIMKRAGYDSPKLTAHSFRHSAITLAYKAQKQSGRIDTIAIQRFARHANFETTLANYIHAVDDSENICADNVAAAVLSDPISDYSGFLAPELA